MNARCSELARPPIQQHEAENAPHSICVLHNGLVRQTGDIEGRVFYCPVGQCYWRYSNNVKHGMHSPLAYPSSRSV